MLRAGWRFAVVLGAFLASLSVACGDAVEVDVGAWAETNTGVTADGWKVSGIDGYAESTGGGVKFGSSSDYALSPVFESNVTQIVMRVRSSSTNVLRILTVTPKIPEGATVYGARPTANRYETETFAWDASEGVRQFMLESPGKSGNWGIASLTVHTDRISAPVGLRGTSENCDAFEAVWTPDAKAAAHEIEVSRVVVQPPRYDVVSAWDFTVLTNRTGGRKDLKVLQDEFPGVLDRVSGENLGLQGKDGGHLQIGMDSVAGAMSVPLGDSGSTRTGCITAWRHPKDASSGCSAYCLDEEGRTNAEVRLTAAADAATDVFEIPDDAVSLRVESLASRRIEVASVIVAAHYAEGSISTNYFGRWKTSRSNRQVKDLFPGEWVWRVRSFDAENVDSAWSSYSSVTIDPDDPPRTRRGFSIQVR